MIICAAIKFHIDKTNKDVVVPCLRHGFGYRLIADLGFGPHDGYKMIEDGFLNHKNEFLNRTDALKYAIECGQLSISTQQFKEKRHEDELFSEDLY